ncbi:MAG: RlmE family RNA methyltransferase [Alphaproteobacteria bacterium]
MVKKKLHKNAKNNANKHILGDMNPSGRVTQKDLFERVKTAKFRKISSTKWLQRQLNDPYVQAAQQVGYRSRAAFKLLQLNDKYNFVQTASQAGSMAIDLGAAPGGWTQILVKELGDNKVIALDILDMEPIEGALFVKADCQSDAAWDQLKILKADHKVHLVLSDMAAPTIGHPQTDQIRTLALAEMAYEFAKEHLDQGGHFVTKIFQGGADQALLGQLKRDFHKVHHAKPAASRKQSPEAYLVALNYRGQHE